MPISVLFLWLLLVWASGWLAFPIARRLLGHALPDGGLSIGRIGFLLLWSLLAFWLGFAHVPVAVSAYLYALLAGAGLWSWTRDRTLKSELRNRRLAIVSSEAVFLCTFLMFFALRSYWSDTQGNNGEKPMDAALIGTLTRAQRLPAENPYAAGARLSSYYFFGHLETALLTRASGTTVRWSYNLMCATLPALCFSALFSVGAGLTRRLDGGIFVSSTILGLGTLQPLFQWFKPDGLLHQENVSLIKNLDFFAASRPLPFAINEFPWFTFNQSDLHAHYFDFPIEISLIALAWAIFRAPNERHRKILLGVAALFSGVQILTNTWDFPAYALAIGLALFLSPYHEGERLPTRQRALGFVAAMFAALIISAPYLLGINTAARGPSPLPVPASPLREWLLLWGPILVAWTAFCAWSTFRFDKRWRWGLGIVAVVILIAAMRLQTTWGYPAGLDGQPQPNPDALKEWFSYWNPARLVIPLILWSAFLGLLGAYFNRGVTRFLPCLALAGLFAVLWSETTWAGFLGDPNYPAFADFKRQDTVFKFGLQAWFLWGTAASAGAYLTLRRWPILLKLAFIPFVCVMFVSSYVDTLGRTKSFGKDAPDDSWRGRQYWDGWGHLTSPEKEAASWLEQHTPPDVNILEAEQKEGGDYTIYSRYTHATGIATIIGPQAHTFQWSPSNKPPKPPQITPDHPVITKQDWLDAKAGVQWDEVYKRKGDARNAFTTENASERLDILHKYNVRYVVWGQLEREQYGDKAHELLARDLKPIAKFGFGPGDDPAHTVEIFEVPPSSTTT